jgi:uncharacterized protein
LLKILRTAEADHLRQVVTGPFPSLTLLVGPDGEGRASIVQHGLRGLDAVRYWAAPLPDADHRALLVSRLGSWAEAPATPSGGKKSAPPEPLGQATDWPKIFEHLLGRAGEREAPLRLVLEEFPRLVESRPKLLQEVERFWSGVRSRGLPIHLVLAGAPDPVFEGMLSAEESWASWIGVWLAARALTYREVGALFPAHPPRERLLVWAVFGGLERHLRHCDPDLSLTTNIRQGILAPASPLLHEGFEQLQRSFQSVGRYASLLRSMASGRREWGEILAGTPEMDTGAQMAPYLARLQRLGLVIGDASLDARPEARSRRYRIVDPFVWFWHRFVLAHLTDLLDGRTTEVWRRHIRPRLDEHASALLPLACRDYLTHYAHERLPANAREVGGLWGLDYEVELAGTLRTGAAVYGHAFWGRGRTAESADDRLLEAMRNTRYGFGKEARLRVLFSTEGFSPGLLRREARTDVLHLIGSEALFAG